MLKPSILSVQMHWQPTHAQVPLKHTSIFIFIFLHCSVKTDADAAADEPTHDRGWKGTLKPLQLPHARMEKKHPSKSACGTYTSSRTSFQWHHVFSESIISLRLTDQTCKGAIKMSTGSTHAGVFKTVVGNQRSSTWGDYTVRLQEKVLLLPSGSVIMGPQLHLWCALIV